MRDGRGYTLVEVLLAVSIFAILAGSTYVALDGLSRASLEHRDRAEDFAQLQLALSRMEADLRQLVSRPVRGPDGRGRPALAGERARLEATRAGWANPSGQRRSTLQRFAWRLDDGGLVRRSWPVTDRTATTEYFDERLLGDAQSLELQFRDEQGRWREQWPADPEAAARLPIAVEFQIESERFGRFRRVVVLQ